VTDIEADHKWRDEADNGNDDRFQAGIHQSFDIRSQTDFEQQQYDTDLGHQPERFDRFDPAEYGRPDDNTGELTDNCGCTQPDCDLGKQACLSAG